MEKRKKARGTRSEIKVKCCAIFFISALFFLSCRDVNLPGTQDSNLPAENKITLLKTKTFISKGDKLEEVIAAEKGTYYEDALRIDMNNIRVDFYEDKGIFGTIKAEKAELFLEEGQNKNDIHFSGNIIYKGKDKTYFYTNSLKWKNAEQKLICDAPFKQVQPLEDGLLQIKGSGFEATKAPLSPKGNKWEFTDWLWKDSTTTITLKKKEIKK